MNVKDITEQYSSLPASQIATAVNEALTHNGSLVITAPPGAGKSTLLPLTILAALGNNGGKVLMLEPRRLAARQIAERMGAEYIRLDDVTGSAVEENIRSFVNNE